MMRLWLPCFLGALAAAGYVVPRVPAAARISRSILRWWACVVETAVVRHQ
jgi:hypothetical protein